MKMMKLLNKIIILFILFIVGAVIFLNLPKTQPIIVEKISPTTTFTPSSSNTITIILVGDIMLNRGVEYMIEKYGNGDFKFPFLKIADYLGQADIVFGNLEGVISDKGMKIGSIYSFRADPKAIQGLVSAGFNVLSLANNHAFDYGRLGLEDCLTKLNNAGIDYVGAGFTETEAFAPLIKEIEGVKIAFLAYTNLGPETWQAKGENSGIAWINEEKFNSLEQKIKETKEKADILIVSLHSGEEYISEPSQFQIDFSRTALDAGADLVVGHHPHVVQPNEQYPSTGSGQAGYIFYSLGNFIFDQNFSEETMKGKIIEIIIKDKKIKEIIPREIKINDYFQPEIILWKNSGL